jgi:hypothetical protein
MVSRADAERLRAAQAAVRALVERDLLAFWESLDLRRPEAARDALLGFVPFLVERYGEMAAVFAADWYDEVRAAEGVPGRFRAEVAPPAETVAVVETTRRLAGALFTDRPQDMLPGLTSKAGKFALVGSRETVTRAVARDPRASGWQRVTRVGACRFCRMLAGRGAVYREATAHFASHGDCNCAAVPSWDQDAPEVDVTLYRASQRTSSMSEQQKAAHNALIRDALDRYVPD